MSLQLGMAFINSCLTENLCIVKEYRSQAEHKCLYVGGKELGFPALSVSGPCSAAVPIGFLSPGAWGVAGSPVSLFVQCLRMDR